MRKMTQEEFDNLPVVEGRKQCPGYADYSAISTFPDRCSFGERCSFGKGCGAISPTWGYVYAPPFSTTGPICPPAEASEYWEARLGMKLEGCYWDIAIKIGPKIPRLLRRKGWTECERRILESWKG
ncbi:hypothetical protein CCP2SC5_2460002 [Azospirillaceae bacterium]